MREKVYQTGKKVLLGACMMLLVLLVTKTNAYAGTNNSQGKAKTISVNRSYSGAMDSTYAWYKTKLTNAGYFYLDFNRKSEDGDNYLNSGWKVSIYVNGSFVLKDYSVRENYAHYISPDYGYPKGTTVYVRITKDGAGTSVPYKFTLCNKASKNWESEKNNSPKTADKIAVNKNYYGNFPENDSTDYFYAAMSKTGYAQVKLGRRELDGDTYSNSGWKMTIIQDGKVVFDEVWISEEDAVNGYTSPKFGCKKGQKIYVRLINNGAGTAVDYKLQVKNTASSVWESENNNSNTKADAIKINKQFYGVCMNNNDVDWFKYKAAKTGTLKFYGGTSTIDDDGSYTFNVYVNNKRVISTATQNEAIGRLGSFKVKKGQTVSIRVNGTSRNPYAVKLKY